MDYATGEPLFQISTKFSISSQDAERVGLALKRAGIDTATIEGFDASLFMEAFLSGFVAKAVLSEKLLPLLQLWESRTQTAFLKGPKPDLDDLKKKYFTWLREKYGQLSFKGLTEKMLSFPLETIFTRVSFSPELPESKEEYLKAMADVTAMKELRDTSRHASAEIPDIMKSRFTVITGDPGAGKSTLLKYMALAFVDGKGGERISIEKDLIPILFPVAAYAEALRKTVGCNYSLNEFIPDFFKGRGLPYLTPLFDNAKKDGKALFLIDGLDEVADEDERRKMVGSISDLIINDESLTNRYVITCRIASYTKATRFERIKGEAFTHYTVLPFDWAHIERFLYNWYCLYEKEVNKREKTCESEAKKKLDKMLAAIGNNRHIYSIATNPLMLTILALIEHEGGELPKNRADLYAKCLKMLAGGWERQRSLHERENTGFTLGDRKINEEFIVEFLGQAAYKMHESAVADIEYGDLRSLLALKFDTRNKDMARSKEQADDFIKIMKERSGIIHELSPGVYGFMHLTFKEYLTARVLTDLTEDRLKELGDRLFKPEWREVVLLTVASLRKRDATNLVKGIFKTGNTHYENLVLAGQCLVDTGRDKVEDSLFDELVGEMSRVMENDFPSPNRVAVGELLGWLGDPREIKEFVPVEGKKYQLSTGEADVKPFEMAKYPVTNSWFEEFIKDEGYKNKAYWSDEGKKWLKHSNAEKPRLWNDRKWKCSNSPVVGINWYEAYAFTKWLSSLKDGYEYRLPNENEWEAAAAGLEKRVYPWGNDWDKNKCNNMDLQIGKTTSVGIFKAGDTPDGIADMAGNVWEWTRSEYHSMAIMEDFAFDEKIQKLFTYDDYFSERREKDRQLPVLRGGSWFNRASARCAYRDWYNPDLRNFYIGVRCVRTLIL